MGQIVVHKRNGDVRYILDSYTQLCTVKSAELKCVLLGEDTVTIKTNSAEAMEFMVGDYIEVYGNVYTLNKINEPVKNGERSFENTMVFEGLQYKLLDAQFRNTDAGGNNPTAEFTMVANMELVMNVLINNINRVAAPLGEVWELGECITTDYKELTFSGEKCLTVLQNQCKEFNTEFEIEVVEAKHYKIHIRKTGNLFPATFTFGKGGGIYKLRRKNVNSNDIVTRLYVEGSTKNIGNGYRKGAQRLRIGDNTESYIDNATAIAAFGVKEGSRLYDDVYPHRTGEVSALVEGSILKFVDDDMFDLNKKDKDGNTEYLIDGTSAKIKFVGQSALAGYQFEISKYDHATHTFTIKPYEDNRGFKIPNENTAYKIGLYDEYVLLDIVMPQLYITDAETELKNRGTQDLAADSQPKVEYELELDSMTLKKNFANDESIVNLFKLGDYLPIIDEDINVNKSIRIKGFTRDCYSNEYKYKLTISDVVEVSIIERLISENNEQNKIITINNLTDVSKARANWRTTQELLGMVYDAEGYLYTEHIRPSSIDTMMLSVGNRAGQFVIQDVVIEANKAANGTPNKNLISVISNGGRLIHYAIEEQNRQWNVNSTTIELSATAGALYLFARCKKAAGDTTCDILASSERFAVDTGDYYYFQIGVISSVFNGYREITLTYGATRITGRNINCGRIESIDKSTWFDLDNAEIGGNITFKSSDGTNKPVSGLETSINSIGQDVATLQSTVGGHSSSIDKLTQDIGEQGNEIDSLGGRTEILEDGISEQSTTISELSAALSGQNEALMEMQEMVDALKGQVDGTIEYWYGTEVPTNTNEPASSWATMESKQEHLGDIYTNTETGLEYRYSISRTSGFYWQEVASTGVGQAIKTANEAMELAGFKSHVYVTASASIYPQPTYKVGDLWLMLNTMQMRFCVTDSDGVAYKPAHWKDAGYGSEDDVLLALGLLQDMATDSIVSPAEKIALKTKWIELAADYAEITAEATANDISQDDFVEAYETLAEYVIGLLANMSENSIVNKDYYNNLFKNYYAARAAVQNRLTESKTRVYITDSINVLPANTYKIGDFWMYVDADGKYKIKICKRNCDGTAKLSDWGDAGYTDDTQANKALGQLQDLADDSKLTPAEKLTLKNEMSNIRADFAQLSLQATENGVVTTDFEKAFNALATYTNILLANMSETSDIVRASYNEKFANYYTERAKVVDALAQKKVDDVEIGQGNYILNGAFFKDWAGWSVSRHEKELFTDSTMGSVIRLKKNVTDALGMLYTGKRGSTKGGNIVLPDGTFRTGTKYTLAFWCKANKEITLSVGIMNHTGQICIAPYKKFTAGESWQRIKYTFTSTGLNEEDTSLFIRAENSTTYEYLLLTKFVLVEGTKAPEWTDNSSEYFAQVQANKDTLKSITDNYTQIDGGLILSTFLKLGAVLSGGVYNESAGVKAMLNDTSEVAAYFGGTYAEALAGTKAGMTIIYHNGKLKAKDADITGKITATSGTIGGFTITANSIKGGSGKALEIGDDNFNTHFGITSKTVNVKVQANDSYPLLMNYDFAYKENNRLRLANTTSKKYDWLNIGVANLMDIDYFSSTSQKLVTGGYGYQFAMLGNGHIAMDGIVEGGGVSLENSFTAANQVTMMKIPLQCNRIAVYTTYSNDILVLPDLYSILATFGYGFMHSNMKKFTFRVTVINIGTQPIYIAGRNNTVVNNKYYYTGDEMPQLYELGSLKNVLKGVYIATNSAKEIMLVYVPSYGYKAIVL